MEKNFCEINKKGWNALVQNKIGDYQSNDWDARKLKAAPTTLIIVARKK